MQLKTWITAALLTTNLWGFSQSVIPATTQTNSNPVICLKREIVEQIVADLAQCDVARLQVDALQSAAETSDSVIQAQSGLIVHLETRLKVANDHISDVEQVLTDQLAAYNALERRHRSERRRGAVLIAALLGTLILTNL